MQGDVTTPRDSAYWYRWALNTLLILGVAHLLAGVVFFFAYNWDDLADTAKFGLLQGGIVVTVIAAIVVGLRRAAGQALLIAASVFTGVLFAVIGQVYQTGADAYELFVAWSVLIVPWVLASRSSAHWFLWMVLCLTSLSLYGGQVLVPLGILTGDELGILMGVMTIAFLLLREVGVSAGLHWLSDRWLRITLALVGIAILFGPAVAYVLEWNGVLPGLLAFGAAAAVLGVIYTRFLPEFAVVAIVTGFVALLGMAIGGKGIDEMIGFGNQTGPLITSLFLLVIWCAALTAATVKVLNAVHDRMRHGEADG